MLDGSQAIDCSQEERDAKERFAAYYERSRNPLMRSLEIAVCGCDFGGNGWTTRSQVDDLASVLELRPGKHLLDLGSGAGWPALYLARISDCKAVLVDLPEVGLRIARDRAAEESLSANVSTIVADASKLPFAANSFDAISHCDLLCCLIQKQSVLECCREVIRPLGRMAFFVISVVPGLSPRERERAITNGPTFIESDMEYPSLLSLTGWKITKQVNVTHAYAASIEAQFRAEKERESELIELFGHNGVIERMSGYREGLKTVQDGLLLRELFVVTPN